MYIGREFAISESVIVEHNQRDRQKEETDDKELGGSHAQIN